MQNTGLTQDFLQVSHGCQACRTLAATVEGIYQAGGRVETDGWSIEWIKAETESSPAMSFGCASNRLPTTVVRRAGAPGERLDGGDTEQRMVLTRKRGEWNLSRSFAVRDMKTYPGRLCIVTALLLTTMLAPVAARADSSTPSCDETVDLTTGARVAPWTPIKFVRRTTPGTVRGGASPNDARPTVPTGSATTRSTASPPRGTRARSTRSSAPHPADHARSTGWPA